MLTLRRGLEEIPVLAKAGGILPMAGEASCGNGVENPEHLTIKIFPGADGSFCLYEDDGECADPEAGGQAVTRMNWKDPEK